ncbi:MAG: nucleoside-diphosphate sugar epimerase/dehydratase [Bacillota bacterium]|nr:nucleoside-diphosphate sugar epimerase/dehydratase [Bacillota bacterium]
MTKSVKQLFLIIFDAAAINFSFYLAFFVRFEGDIIHFSDAVNYIYVYTNMFIWITIIKLIVFYVFKMYSSLWRYASVEELFQVVLASVVATAATVSLLTAFSMSFPRSIYLLTFIFDTMLLGGIRFSYRFFRRNRRLTSYFRKNMKRILIIGGGQAASMLVKEIKENTNSNMTPVAILDDDKSKIGLSVNGVKIVGKTKDIIMYTVKYNIDEIIIAIPSADRKAINEIVNHAKDTKCKLRTLPGMYEIADGKVSIKEIRDVSIEDLLGREEVELDTDEIETFIKSKTILVTGGGGSIGSELCRQICHFGPKKLYILDNYENNAYDLDIELRRKYDNINIEVIIATVRDEKRLNNIFSDIRPDVVFHAAAHKHVPLMEANPIEAVKNNIFGTLNTINMAKKYNAEKFVLISTDKAVNPTNVMGATKRTAEMLIQSQKDSNTEFVAVRFGNVLGSNGSVIPLFKKQIKEGGPVTLTHPDIIRYFMTIPEASQLVLQAGAMASGGEIFVLDMGSPIKIKHLAEDLIKLSGFEPYIDIDIKITGLRPGEKLYEELLMDEENNVGTKNKKIFIEKPSNIDFDGKIDKIMKFENCMNEANCEEIRERLKEIVETYVEK